MADLLRVLMVEDDEEDAELLRLELERGGRRVHMQRVQTERDFLAALHDETWNIIISDYAMPGFDGLRAFDLYRESGIDTPFIFVSGALGEERAVKAMIGGARDYILKGNLGRLNAAVDREVAEARSRKVRREAEAANAREQRRLAVALHATGAGVFEFHIPEDGRGYCSDRLAEILGCSVNEMRGFDDVTEWLLEHVHPQDLARVEKYRQNLIEGQEADYSTEFRLRRQEEWRNIWCLAEVAARDNTGSVSDVVGVMLDQTEHRRMAEQFRQAQKMEAVGQLAGGIAHDFNNLLTVILNFGKFALESLSPDAAARDDMKEVLNAARRAETLTKQLLAFSRSQPVDPEVLNVNGLLQDVEKMLRQLLGADIEFQIDLAPDLWNVRVDIGCLEQVIVNLAINARDAMPAGGTLSIETRNVDFDGIYDPEATQIIAGQFVAISITDNGIGMDAETQRRLFEPFFTTKGPGKGTGLGLATCYGIIQQARGFIRVDSKPDRGATFKVLLPREHSGASDAPKPETKPERVCGEEVILVVEDELSVRKLITRVLSPLGYTVLEAADGLEALKVARSSHQRVRLVLTDVVMPKMGGPELVEELLSLDPDMKILYISGHTGSGFVPESGPMLQKPFSPQVLAGKLRDVLDGRLTVGKPQAPVP